MTPVLAYVDGVAIASAVAAAGQYLGFFKVGNNPLYSPLGDAYLIGYIAQPQFRLARQQDQHVLMVRQERPTLPARWLSGTWCHSHDRRFSRSFKIVHLFLPNACYTTYISYIRPLS